MITKEYNVIELFAREPWNPLTFKQVKKLSRNKSDNYVHTTLKKFVKNKILKEQKVGNNILYSLDSNVFALNTMGFVAEHKAKAIKHLPHKNIQRILNKIKTSFYSVIITGSYARNKQDSMSDLDLAIICDDTQKPNAILSEIRLESELMTPEIHPFVISESEFLEMLTNNEENYGKEIARNNLVITGGKQFFSIIIEAIENGFHG